MVYRYGISILRAPEFTADLKPIEINGNSAPSVEHVGYFEVDLEPGGENWPVGCERPLHRAVAEIIDKFVREKGEPAGFTPEPTQHWWNGISETLPDEATHIVIRSGWLYTADCSLDVATCK